MLATSATMGDDEYANDPHAAALRHISTTAVFEPVAMATFAPMGVSPRRRSVSPAGGAGAGIGAKSGVGNAATAATALLPVPVPQFPPPLMAAASANPLANTGTTTTQGTAASTNTNTVSTIDAASYGRTVSMPLTAASGSSGQSSGGVNANANANATSTIATSKAYQRRLANMTTRLENTRVELGQLELKLQKAVAKQNLKNDVYKTAANNKDNNKDNEDGTDGAPYQPSATIFVKAGAAGHNEELLLLFASHLGQLATSVLECDRASIYFFRKGKLIGYRKDADRSRSVLQLDVGSGVAGKCAELGHIMNVPSAYKCPFFNRNFDRATGYRTNSILCLPLLSGDGAAVIAVLQLINKDDDRPFDADDEFAASILLSMAVDVLRRYFTLEMYVLETPVPQNSAV